MNARTSNGRPVVSRGPSAILRLDSHPQLGKLDQLINAAMSARVAASRGELFETTAGKILTNAAHDLFECDQLYDLAATIGPPDAEITRDEMNEHDADLRMGRSFK